MPDMTTAPLSELDGVSVLAGDNGLIYLFDTRPTSAVRADGASTTQDGNGSMSQDGMDGIPLCPLLNVIELPPDVSSGHTPACRVWHNVFCIV
jgi:hypothetical protein